MYKLMYFFMLPIFRMTNYVYGFDTGHGKLDKIDLLLLAWLFIGFVFTFFTMSLQDFDKTSVLYFLAYTFLFFRMLFVYIKRSNTNLVHEDHQ